MSIAPPSPIAPRACPPDRVCTSPRPGPRPALAYSLTRRDGRLVAISRPRNSHQAYAVSLLHYLATDAAPARPRAALSWRPRIAASQDSAQSADFPLPQSAGEALCETPGAAAAGQGRDEAIGQRAHGARRKAAIPLPLTPYPRAHVLPRFRWGASPAASHGTSTTRRAATRGCSWPGMDVGSAIGNASPPPRRPQALTLHAQNAVLEYP